MANPGSITIDGVTYPLGYHGNVLDGKTDEKLRAQIMRKSFDADRFHRNSRRVHGTEDDYRRATGDYRA